MVTARPRNGDQSALSQDVLPLGLVTAEKADIKRVAASAAFSPSTTMMGAEGRSASL